VAASSVANFEVEGCAGEFCWSFSSGVAVREGPLDPASNRAEGGGPIGFAAFHPGDAYFPSSVCQSPFDSNKISSTESGHVERMESKKLCLDQVRSNFTKGIMGTKVLTRPQRSDRETFPDHSLDMSSSAWIRSSSTRNRDRNIACVYIDWIVLVS